MSSKNSIFDYNSDDVRSGAVEGSDQPSGDMGEGGRKTSRLIYFAVIVVISIVLAAVLLSGIKNRVNQGLIMELQPGDVAAYSMGDGGYSGSFSSGGMSAAVTVNVTSGYIVNITLDDYVGIDAARAQLVFDCVIVAQSLDTGYDEIGTQPTDKIVLLAIENALNGGGK